MQPGADRHASNQPSGRDGTMLSARHGPADATPNVARVYDALLDGKDNYAADRAAARRLAAAVPGVELAARANRSFLGRAVRYLAGQDITQFLDIGSGLPTRGNVHHVAQEVNPDARVTYADIDPVVVAHARALLADAPAAGPPKVTAVEADLRYPRNLITSREIRDHLDLTQPVGLLLVAVLHFLTDRDRPHDAVRCLAGRLAQGSYVVISHGTADHIDSDAARIAAAVYDGASAPGVARSREDIERFLDGLEMVPPGITDAAAWHPGCAPACPSARPTLFYAGIGRVPCSADDDRLRRRSPRMPPVSTPAATTPVTVQTTISLLEALGAELGRSGWKTRLQIASGRAPSLHVQNPAAAQLAETIYAAPKDDGFWFWWSWYEPIAQASADTAAIIVRVLRARPERC